MHSQKSRLWLNVVFLGNILDNSTKSNMIANDDKIANAIATGNRLNAFRKRLRYSFCAFNICFKYKICLKELQKGAPGTEAGVTVNVEAGMTM
jgi:hypothetical protein